MSTSQMWRPTDRKAWRAPKAAEPPIKFRPASQDSPLADELRPVLGPLTEGMVRRHLAASRKRAYREGLLTPAEIAAMEAHGLSAPEAKG